MDDGSCGREGSKMGTLGLDYDCSAWKAFVDVRRVVLLQSM